MKYNVEERLQQLMDDVAEEIRNHGKDSLYLPGQKVCSGQIIVDIDEDCLATVTYERTVLPERTK